MRDTLIIGDYAHSSWSLRGWLLFRRFGIPVGIEVVDFLKKPVSAQLCHAAPAQTVPTFLGSDGTIIWDSLAIAEEMASRNPDAGLWPSDPVLRALSRSLAAEMHSGFAQLRSECPMNLRATYKNVPVSDALRADLDRLEVIWSVALDRSGGPWLCGSYSVADAFFAPVAARIAGYGLDVGDVGRRYTEAHLSDGAFRRWRAMGLISGSELPWYSRDYPRTEWRGPKVLHAEAVEEGSAENQVCPYSGDPVTHLMRIEGRVFGFCNAFCRDKTVADPEAWPDFVALLRGTATAP